MTRELIDALTLGSAVDVEAAPFAGRYSYIRENLDIEVHEVKVHEDRFHWLWKTLDSSS